MHAALTASGVSGGDKLRIVAYACDVVESLLDQPLPAEAPLLALAVARYSFKFWLTLEQQESLAHHIRVAGCMHSPRVEDVERFLLRQAAR